MDFLPRLLRVARQPLGQSRDSLLETNKYKHSRRIVVSCSVTPGTPRRATWTCSTEAEIRCHCVSGALIKVKCGDYRSISLAVSAIMNARQCWCNPFSDKR